ncbi:rhamnulokinase [Actinospica durhamensis]|uniref:Rhamnulokinase n=1 Tax=Actinospica durhamensis TaxID=1508375 RepID=A0A941EJ37_9ACTN|nr:rhamnulokinase family protein [Actinospica durhamensis]MBR7831758.1 rhamnulokinase [Actinospica durhamensis]
MNPSTTTFAAADLGASSGRVVLGRVGRESLEVTEVHRFPNTPVQLADGLHWDILALYQGVLDGLRAAGRVAEIASVGIDTWAVDYGLIDGEGVLLGNPFHYRDTRTAHVPQRVWQQADQAEMYRVTGLQQLVFNTVYQLVAAAGSAQMAAAHRMLMIPDLLTYWLTGSIGAEETNASTTGLFDARAGVWAADLAKRLGISPHLLPPLRRPGDLAGLLRPGPARHTGLSRSTPVTVVASHDTASAVVAVPAVTDAFAYISCGTWSLAGLELDAPILTEASRAANFTNERGIDGTVRYLRNIMGLWLLEECRRTWADAGHAVELPRLLADAARAEPFAALIDPDSPEFLAPGDMPKRIEEYCLRTGQRPPNGHGAFVRAILESLALAHRRTLRQAAELSGRDIEVIHLVGGGSRNALLCQLTADATGLAVIAGPTEATALGNILVQARTHAHAGELADLRRLVAESQSLRHYAPHGSEHAWTAAAARVGLG